MHTSLVDLEKRLKESKHVLNENKKEVKDLTRKLQVKDFDMGALCEFMIISKAEISPVEKEKVVLKGTNDDLVGRFVCRKNKKSRRTVEALLTTVPYSSLLFSLIAELYILKWASKEVVELNSEKNTQELE